MHSLQKDKHRPSYFLNLSSSPSRPLSTFLFLLSLSLLIQIAQGYSRITFCYNKNNYEGKTTTKVIIFMLA